MSVQVGPSPMDAWRVVRWCARQWLRTLGELAAAYRNLCAAPASTRSVVTHSPVPGCLGVPPHYTCPPYTCPPWVATGTPLVPRDDHPWNADHAGIVGLPAWYS